MMKLRKPVIAIVLALTLVLPSAALAGNTEMMDTEMKDTDMKDTKMMDTKMMGTEMMDTDMKDTEMMDMSDAYKSVRTLTKNGMEFIELRQLSTNLGYVIEWNGKTRMVTLTTTAMYDMMKTMSKHVIKLKVGYKRIMVNDKEHDTTIKPMIVNGRTYVTKAFADMYIVQMMK